MRYIILLILSAYVSLQGYTRIDKAIKGCSTQYTNQMNGVIQSLKNKYDFKTLGMCKEYMKLIKDFLDITNQISNLQRNLLDITAVASVREGLDKYKECLGELGQYQPQYTNAFLNSEITKVCSAKYVKDQDELLKRMKSEKNELFIKHLNDFSDLIKLSQDTSSRIAYLEANFLDVNLLMILRGPLETTYKNCLTQSIGLIL